jgi:hypothetical protein
MAKGEFCGCHGDGSVVLKRDGLFGRKVKVVNMNLYLSTGGFTIYTSLTPSLNHTKQKNRNQRRFFLQHWIGTPHKNTETHGMKRIL